MTQDDSNLNDAPRPGWQRLAALDLPGDSDLKSTVRRWLEQVLLPLDLQADLFAKIAASAQEAVRRGRDADPLLDSPHLHLVIFVPEGRAHQVQSRGFFRVQMADAPSEGGSTSGHTIQFYLYDEGE